MSSIEDRHPGPLRTRATPRVTLADGQNMVFMTLAAGYDICHIQYGRVYVHRGGITCNGLPRFYNARRPRCAGRRTSRTSRGES